MYPDAAHKPEMVISLSAFCGFAGFLSPDHMQQLLQDHPQLNEVLGANNVLQYLEAQRAQDNTNRQLVSLVIHCSLKHAACCCPACWHGRVGVEATTTRGCCW